MSLRAKEEEGVASRRVDEEKEVDSRGEKWRRRRRRKGETRRREGEYDTVTRRRVRKTLRVSFPPFLPYIYIYISPSRAFFSASFLSRLTISPAPRVILLTRINEDS